MPKSRIPSPARSLGSTTPSKRKKSSGSRSLCSPAVSTASGRLSSLIDQFKENNMESFALSPLNSRSVLNDNTDVVEPRRKSWWKKLNENSHVMEVLEDNKVSDTNNVIEKLDLEFLSQEKNNYTLNLPESSDNESIHSIVLPQRKLFTRNENQPNKMLGQLIDNRDTLAKLHKTKTEDIDKTATVDTRKLFSNARRSKPIFPPELLKLSPNKTAAEKTKENMLAEPKLQVRNIFGNRPANKRKNMFADFILSDSEDDEIPVIQPKVFGFQRKFDQRRISPVSKGRDGSPASSITTDMEMDDWKLLPSSTMVEIQQEDMEACNTPIKRPRLSKLSEAKESEAGTNTLQTNTTADKTKQSYKSVDSKNKSKSSPKVNTTLSNSLLTRSMLKNASKREEDANSAIKQVTKGNKSQSKITPDNNQLYVSPSKPEEAEKRNTMLTRNSPKAIENELTSDENNVVKNATNNATSIINKSTNKKVSISTVTNKSENERNTEMDVKQRTYNIKAQDKSNKTGTNDVEQNEEDDDENNFTLEYENDYNDIFDKAAVQHVEHKIQNDNIKNKSSVMLEKDSQRDEINKSNITDRSIKQVQKPNKTIEEYVKSQQHFHLSTVVDGNVANDQELEKDIQKDGINQSNTTNKSLKQVQKPTKTTEEYMKSQQNLQLFADVDGNVSHDQELETNQNQESKDEGKVNQEDFEEAIVSQEDENEDIENDQIENNSNVSKDNEEQVNMNEESEQQIEYEANESKGEEVNVSQETEDDNDESRKEDLDNESQCDNEVHECDGNEDEANESEGEEVNVSQETEDEHDESRKEDLVNGSQCENEVYESDGNEDEANESDVNEEEANVSQEVEANESQEINEDANETEDVEDDNENNEEEDVEEAVNESQVNEESANKSQELDDDKEESSHEVESEDDVNEGEEVEDDLNEDEEVEDDQQMEDSDEGEEVEDDQQMEDSDEADKAIASDADMSVDEADESETDQDSSHKERQIEEQNEIELSAEEIEESSNVTHDTTGKNRKQELNKSPEVILSDKTNQMNSFIVKGRNTSVRKTKSMIQNLILRPSLAPHRDSTGFSDGTQHSSAEGSGWDSHRTTRKTLRQTFGKDFTPRKSLRTLVMEKSAKRQTENNIHRQTDHLDIHSETVKFPLANSTEMPEIFNKDVEDMESDHEVSRRTRLAELEMYLKKIKQQNIEKELQMAAAFRNSFKVPVGDPLNMFRKPNKPAPRRPKNAQSKPKKQTFIPLDELPAEVIADMKYKPPKRYKPSNASWITKRLYKYLENKLQARYDYKARVRAEKLVETLYQFTKDLRRHKVAPTDAVVMLKNEFAKLDIVRTHFEFYGFFEEFMPREVMIKVIPDIVNKIPMPRDGIFSDILRCETQYE